jgi:hypothetical protein
MPIYSSIKIDGEDKKKLDQLAKTANESLVSYLHLAIDYFHVTGVNPSTKFKSFADELETLKKELSKLIKESRDAYIGFIRELESKRLNVIANNVQDIGNALIDYLKHDAPRKDDIVRLKESLSQSKPVPTQTPIIKTLPTPIPEENQNSDQDKASTKRAKQLWTEFTAHGRKDTFGNSVKFESSVFEDYKKRFNEL